MPPETDRRYATMNGLAAPSTEEMGSSGLRISGGRVDEEFDNAWRQHKKARTIQEMLTDPMVSRSMWTFELLIKNVEWDAEPANDSNEAMQAADFLKSVLFEDQSHSWNESLSHHLSMVPWGWAYHELVWKRRLGYRNRNDPGANSKFNDGKWGLRKTAFRGQNTLFEWMPDDKGMRQLDTYSGVNRGVVDLPIEQSLLFRLSNYRDSPEGRSLLRAAYVPWYRKKNVATFQGIGVERDLVGLPVIRVPIEIMLASGSQEALVKHEFERMGRNIRQDDQAYVMLPSNRDESGNYYYDFTLASTTGTGTKIDTQPIIDAYNKEILMALMTDVTLIGHEQVGSFSLHSSATQLLSFGLSGMMDSIQEVYNRHFVPRLFGHNGLNPELMPKLIHGDVETVDLDELGNFIVRMAQGGFDLTDVENEIRRRAGFPLREAGDIPPKPQVDEPEEDEDLPEMEEDAA
jgi:hypothetical protein